MRKKLLAGLFIFPVFLFAQWRWDHDLSVLGGISGSNFKQTFPSKERSGYLYQYSTFLDMRSEGWFPDLLIGYQKRGGYTMRTLPIPGGGSGSESFAVNLSYLTFTPLFKCDLNIAASFHMKFFAGPYIDYLVGFESHPLVYVDTRSINSFKKFSFGAMYGMALNLFNIKRIRFSLHLMGQNDFTPAGDNTGYTFRNNTYSALLGVGYGI